jgi:hypothetical protein
MKTYIKDPTSNTPTPIASLDPTPSWRPPFSLGSTGDGYSTFLPLYEVPRNNSTLIDKVGIMGRVYYDRGNASSSNISSMFDIILCRAYNYNITKVANPIGNTGISLTVAVCDVPSLSTTKYYLGLISHPTSAVNVYYDGMWWGTPPNRTLGWFTSDKYTVIQSESASPA